MAAAEAALGERLAAVGIGALDVAVLRGDQRQATVLLADWIRKLTLEDGSAAHGIRYDSRHATGSAWAYWLRRVDDGHTTGTEPLIVLAGERAIDELDPIPSLLRLCMRTGHTFNCAFGLGSAQRAKHPRYQASVTC